MQSSASLLVVLAVVAAVVVGIDPVSAGPEPPVCGDVDASGTVAASDALRVLQSAVGLQVELLCADCPGTTTTTMPAFCRFTAFCPAGKFCDRPGCVSDGACLPRGQVCECEFTASCAQVCGCDGIHYDSSCAANRLAVSVAGPAPCAGSCFNDGHCSAGEFCLFGSTCEGTGTCESRSPTCGCELLGVCPDVCGCDFKTYSSICAAYRAGVSVFHDGDCP